MKNIVINKICGKLGGKVGGDESGKLRQLRISEVVHKAGGLFTKLSTWFCTRFAESIPRIHRLYYYN